MAGAEIKVGTCGLHYGGREKEPVDLRTGKEGCGAQNGKTKIQIETGHFRSQDAGGRIQIVTRACGLQDLQEQDLAELRITRR